MERAWRFIVAFGRFWYEFIVGDDWTMAAAVAAALLATAILNANQLVAWWLVPVVVVVMLGISLRRGSGMRR